MKERSNIYHEKQHLQFCAVHALNNLFQNEHFCSKEKLDNICLQLNTSKWLNPHRSLFQIGNYDINVIIVYLQQHGYDVIWFDKRRKVDDIVADKVKGFLLNSPSPLRMMRWEVSINYFKHWYAVCQLHEQAYYNLDSKLTVPQRIGGDEDLKKFIVNKLQKGNTELLIVVCKDTTKEEVLVEKELTITG